MSRTRGWTDEQLIEAVKDSFSKAEVLRRLGLLPAGGSYLAVDRVVSRLGLDTSHYTGRGHLLGRHHSWSKSRPLNEILVEFSDYLNGRGLKKRLFEANLLRNQCYVCGQLPIWHGSPLVLQIDHINGIHDDNRIENLRILCGHCHSQTPTYCGRNIKKCPGLDSNQQVGTRPQPSLKRSRTPIPAPGQCKKCNIELKTSKCGYCAKCKNQPKIMWPTATELESMLWQESTTKIAARLGVSDKAIEKKCKKLGISKPPRGYWAKLSTQPDLNRRPTDYKSVALPSEL